MCCSCLPHGYAYSSDAHSIAIIWIYSAYTSTQSNFWFEYKEKTNGNENLVHFNFHSQNYFLIHWTNAINVFSGLKMKEPYTIFAVYVSNDRKTKITGGNFNAKIFLRKEKKNGIIREM